MDLAKYIDVSGVWLAEVFSQPLLQALAVPIGFYLIGAFAKKIIRGGNGTFFAVTDWFLAPDALLASIGSLIIQLLDLVSKFDPVAHTGKTRVVAILLAINVFVYLVVLAFHVHYEKANAHTNRKKFWMLVVIANFLAFAVMCISILGIRGSS